MTVVAEVLSLGLITAVLPAARAKGSFWLMISSGKFHGVIMPMTPMGSWTTRASVSGPRALWASPWVLRARLAAYSHSSAVPATSLRDWVMGLPVSRVSASASASASRRTRSATFNNSFDRWEPLDFRQPPSKALRAAVTARSTSSWVPLGKDVTSTSWAGLSRVKVSPVLAWASSPLMIMGR
ncbi:hypothetical protein D9M69_585390 [compost metagenome]